MRRIIFERVLHASLSLLAVTALTFTIVRLSGDPVLVYLPLEATKEDEARLRTRLGLDRPMTEQYARYLGEVARGDLGFSYRTHGPVAEVIASRLPATLQLGGVALLLVLLTGVPLGI